MNTNLVLNSTITNQITNTLTNKKKDIENHLGVINLEDNLNLSKHYADICHRYSLKNKWILMINPDESPLDELALNNQIDTTNILKVKANRSKVELKAIEMTLCKGNCSAVVLCNPTLNNEQLAKLNKCAQIGKTQCIILKNNYKLH